MSAEQTELVAVARILAPQGNRGEVRVEPLTDNVARLTTPGSVILSRVPGPTPDPGDRVAELVAGRPHGKLFALKLAGSDSISQAETLRDHWVKVRVAELAPLPEGSYYLFEIIGSNVVTEDGEPLGRIEEIMRGAGNDVYVVRGRQGELLLPAVREVILNVDRVSRLVTARPPLPYEGGGRQ